MHAAEKIKQRLLGLLGVGITLLAFVPVIIEEPPTYLEVVPTRVPLAPVVDAPEPLFDDLMAQRAGIEQQVDAERSGYARALTVDLDSEVTTADELEGEQAGEPEPGRRTIRSAPSEVLVPLRWLSEGEAQRERSEAVSEQALASRDATAGQAITSGYALSRAWVVVLQRASAPSVLEAKQSALMAQRIPSFVASRNALVTEDAEPLPAYVLLVGPELRREDAIKRMAQLQKAYPDAALSIEPYFPGRISHGRTGVD